jgi:hypothetical protein
MAYGEFHRSPCSRSVALRMTMFGSPLQPLLRHEPALGSADTMLYPSLLPPEQSLLESRHPFDSNAARFSG